ncbi:MAG TPA: SDR family NAD(P)-dependent oxidoreductase [Myxococcales bacterium]|nr:SDR family NAD(P)-dependent oxidoreductase [Myxococcales bacterium]
MDTRNLSGKVGVVTGAGSGIGRATALALAERGANLAICDVDDVGLAETADRIKALGREVFSQTVDVAQADAMQAFSQATRSALGRVDIVVNNAGIGIAGLFVDVPLEAWTKILGINISGVIHGCHAFLPGMIEADAGGHIVNIASMAGYCQAPGMTAYGTTKFGVLGFSECLRAELSLHGIGVTAVCPGVINTAIVRTSKMYGLNEDPELREQGIRAFERRNYSPERVAQKILRAVQKNRGVAPISPEAWAGYWVKRLAPGLIAWFARRSARANQNRMA